MYICIKQYIYIYIYIYIHTHVHTYIYIYIYSCRASRRPFSRRLRVQHRGTEPDLEIGQSLLKQR